MFRPIRIKNYLTVMEAFGVAAENVLAGSGIVAEKLSDPAYLIDTEQTNVVIGNILRLRESGSVSFEMGQKCDLADLGIVAYAMMSSKTIRQSLNLWIRYSNALVGSLWRVAPYYSDTEHLTLEISEDIPTVGGLRFCAEEFLAFTRKIGGALAQEAPRYKRIELAYPEPKYVDRYREFCDGPIVFNAPRTLVTFENSWIDKSLRTSDREFNEICVRHCGQIMKQIVRGSSLLAQIRTILLKCNASIPKLDDVAAQLGVSSRTLRRQLADEGTSYQHLVNEFRFDLAKQYAVNSDMAAKEISYLLGYADVAAFQRMFAAKAGKRLKQYRNTFSHCKN